jgi:hypothetical protein
MIQVCGRSSVPSRTAIARQLRMTPDRAIRELHLSTPPSANAIATKRRNRQRACYRQHAPRGMQHLPARERGQIRAYLLSPLLPPMQPRADSAHRGSVPGYQRQYPVSRLGRSHPQAACQTYSDPTYLIAARPDGCLGHARRRGNSTAWIVTPIISGCLPRARIRQARFLGVETWPANV